MNKVTEDARIMWDILSTPGSNTTEQQVRHAVSDATSAFIGAQYTTLTRSRLVVEVDSALSNMIHRNQIADYKVVCNNTNNPPSVTDKNQVILDISVKKYRLSEVIHMQVDIR